MYRRTNHTFSNPRKNSWLDSAGVDRGESRLQELHMRDPGDLPCFTDENCCTGVLTSGYQQLIKCIEV